MNTLTKQEIFDAALFGIRSQNYVRSHENNACMYNGPNNTHCAVGWALVKAGVSVSPEHNSDSVYGLTDTNHAARVVFGECGGNFLQDLQNIHDNALKESPEFFEGAMHEFTIKHGLVYTSVGGGA